MSNDKGIRKQNVDVFNSDISLTSKYRYTTDDRPSLIAANERMTRGIRDAVDLRGKRVLDIGCGDGTFTLALVEMGAASVTGIDPADKAIDAARIEADRVGLSRKVKFYVQNVYDLDNPREQYDVVVLRGVLHHLPDPERAVYLAAKLANEIVVLEPNGANPALKIIERLSPYHVEHEEQSFLPATVDHWLAKAGKKPVYRKLINFVPVFCPAPIVKLLKLLEPVIEATPGLRFIGCAQYVVKAITENS